jgi:hypothetical protein
MEYAYKLSDTATGKLSGGRLRAEIMAAIAVPIQGIRTAADDLFVSFDGELSPAEKAVLDGVIHLHAAPNPPRRTAVVDSNSGVTAAGNNQATATFLLEDRNIVTTSTPNSGVRLPDADKFLELLAVNQSGLPIKVYPPVGATIGKTPVNLPVTLPDDAARMFWGFGPKWY